MVANYLSKREAERVRRDVLRNNVFTKMRVQPAGFPLPPELAPFNPDEDVAQNVTPFPAPPEISGRSGGGISAPSLPLPADPSQIVPTIQRFGRFARDRVDDWQDFTERNRASDNPVLNAGHKAAEFMAREDVMMGADFAHAGGPVRKIAKAAGKGIGGLLDSDIAKLAAKKARGEPLSPEETQQVQDALGRLFRPDYNAVPTSHPGADDIAKNLQRARNVEARIPTQAESRPVVNEAADPFARFENRTPDEAMRVTDISAARREQIAREAREKAQQPQGDVLSARILPPNPLPMIRDAFRSGGGPPTDTPMFAGMEPPRPARDWREVGQDLINASPTLKSAIDWSAPGRQLAPMLYAHPTRIVPVLKAQFKAMKAENFEASQAALRSKPYAYYRDLAGVELGDLGTDLTKREENIGSALAERIPGVGATSRAYTAAINEGRDWLFAYMYKHVDPALLTEAGLRNGGLQELQRIGRLVNASTGRGSDLGRLLKQNKIAGIPAFWAPRLLVGRVQLPLSAFTSSSSAVRTEAVRQTVAFVGVNTALLAMIAKSGVADVELDPRSSDFGQIKVGDRRYDLWAGYRPIANLVARLGYGLSGKPNMKTIGGDLYSKRNLEVVTRFLRTKLSPIAGEAVSQSVGRDLSGEDVSDAPGGALGHAAMGLAASLFLEELVQDMIAGYEDDGIEGALKSAGATLPYAFGVGGGHYREDEGGPTTSSGSWRAWGDQVWGAGSGSSSWRGGQWQ